MTQLFVTNDFEKKFDRLSKATKKTIDKLLYGIEKEKIHLRRIPYSKLYAKKIKRYVILFSKSEERIVAIDMITSREFEENLKKSSIRFML